MATKKVVSATVKVQIPPREVLYEESRIYDDNLPLIETLVFEVEVTVRDSCPGNVEAVQCLMDAIESHIVQMHYDDPKYSKDYDTPFIQRFNVSLINRTEVESK